MGETQKILYAFAVHNRDALSNLSQALGKRENAFCEMSGKCIYIPSFNYLYSLFIRELRLEPIKVK